MRNDGTMSETARLITAEELEHFPTDERYELVEGRLVRMTPVGYLHGRTVVRLASMLERHARATGAGEVLTEVGFTLKSDPDTVLAPDIAFIRRDRLPASTPRGFWRGPADLAIQVLSPEDTPSKIRQKIDEYLLRGTSCVVVIDPEKRIATVFRRARQPVTLRSEETLDLSEVVPGFACQVRAIVE